MDGLIPLPQPPAERRLGRSALTVGAIAYGLWRFVGTDVKSARTRIETALAHGLTLIDGAAVYGLDWGGTGFGESEALMGAVLADAPALRGRMVLATKCGITPGIPYDSSARAIRESCEASLRRLRTDVIDLFQIHRPDLLAHPAEIADALAALREEGKIREAGVSNHTPAQTAALMHHLPFPLAAVQPEFSALAIEPLESGLLDLCMEHGLAPLAWSPLAGGLLGADQPPVDARAQRVAGELRRIAVREDVTSAAVALAWVLAHPARPVPIIGTQSPERIADAATALRVRLTRADWYAVLVASRGTPMP